MVNNRFQEVRTMKVLLCDDIKKLGWLGDIVEVNEGYARN